MQMGREQRRKEEKSGGNGGRPGTLVLMDVNELKIDANRTRAIAKAVHGDMPWLKFANIYAEKPDNPGQISWTVRAPVDSLAKIRLTFRRTFPSGTIMPVVVRERGVPAKIPGKKREPPQRGPLLRFVVDTKRLSELHESETRRYQNLAGVLKKAVSP
jgi:hypothetical protein